MSIGATEPFSREFDPPEQLEFEEYPDPFTLNEDGTIDMDLSGEATIRGERLRVKERLRVEGDAVIDGDLIVQGIDILAEIQSIKQSIAAINLNLQS
jgi:cytoskeletal protein CcmA (bactofilin family)